MKKRCAKILTILLLTAALTGLIPTAGQAAFAGSSAGVVTMSYGSLNVRKSASTASAVLKTLPKNSLVTLISKSGSWWTVEYADGRYGYCAAEYISPVSGAWAAYTTSALNVRSGPGMGYPVIDGLYSGEYVVVLASSGSWRKVLLDGIEIGYVSAAYLRAAGSAQSYPALSLQVPSYKQTDSRWSWVTVGASGKTLGAIGCSTVALAMSESYRTGSTVDPAAMENRLSYTAGGAVYWPDRYSAYTGSDYLNKAYNLLKSGKPCLIGLKTAGGSQHWVVVTGYTGGENLTASGFAVNDPGSSSRTTLQQVINAYPYFYKLMAY